MTDEIGNPLDEYDITTVLHRRGIGVLGLADGTDAYTIPVAYAYDEENNRCVFRFVMTDDSLKRTFLDGTDTASLTVFEWNGANDWNSIIARGPISRIATDDLGRVAALFAAVGEEAALEIFNRPLSAYETVWYALDVTSMTGRGVNSPR